MPRAGRTCAIPGCPEIVHGTYRCPAHSKDQRPSAARRGYDARWQRTSASFLSFHPVCETIGCGLPATEADHIDGAGPGGPRGHDWTNLRALCKAHHAMRTARDQPGGWNADRGWQS